MSGEHILMMENDRASSLVIQLATTFGDFLSKDFPGWKVGYYRFLADKSGYGGNASFEDGERIHLVPALSRVEFFRGLNGTAHELFKALGQELGVMLLVLDSSQKYEVKFEWNNLDAWRITKLNGASGRPAGL
jgi:hypothetical protein